MNNNTKLLLILLGVGAASTAVFFLLKDNDGGQKKYTLSNGVQGTAEELTAMGYMPVMVGENLTWIEKTQYENAQNQAGGNKQKLVNILNAAGAIINVVSGAIENN